MNFNFYKLKEEYNTYLRQIDHRVQDTSYINKKQNRPFIGILLSFDDGNVLYLAPLASPKPKHSHMKNQIDFLKINDGVYGAINFNNMIPVNNSLIEQIDLNIYSTDSESVKKYKNLLNNQLSWCNANKGRINHMAEHLYYGIINNKFKGNVINRCCDFKKLENALQKYITEQQLSAEPQQPKKQSVLQQRLEQAAKKAAEYNKNLHKTSSHNKAHKKGKGINIE